MIRSILILILSGLFSAAAYSQTWVQTLNGRNVWSLAQDSQENIYAGGLTGNNSRIWRSSNAGNSWDTVYTGSGQAMWDFGFDENGVIYVANYSNGLLRSSDGGQTFELIPSSVFNNKNLQGVECGSAGYVFVTSSTGFFRSTDHGQTFTETALTGLNCLPVLVDIDSSNIVYAGVTSATGGGIGFYRSADFGETFSVNLNPGKNGYNLFQKLNGDIFMITTTSPYNFDVSTDKGLTWTTVSNLSSAQRGITVSGFNHIYTAGNGGVFRSTNNGQTFENFNFTSSATPILSFVNFAVAKIAIGTTGSANGGVWLYTEGVIQNISGSVENASGYKLSQNYPNPFNPVTRIDFEIPASSGGQDKVSLKIFDVAGNEVKILVNQYKPSGKHFAVWDASDFPGGVYFYRILSGNYSETKKLILLK
ncbi:MAG TPA: T9SS type A sorting domain-containing protein [Ignavibacteria bacterium]|nr:T9SS type A sorting domain-containing protein [Ignavibacteria bacterium]HMR39727.1 T9SS type A sorting domain-containing protein [Ignavibacteria bacterium]